MERLYLDYMICWTFARLRFLQKDLSCYQHFCKTLAESKIFEQTLARPRIRAGMDLNSTDYFQKKNKVQLRLSHGSRLFMDRVDHNQLESSKMLP